MEQQLAAGLGEWQIAELVEDNEIQAAEMIGDAPLSSGPGLGLEAVHQVNHVVEPSARSIADAGPGNGDSQMGFARAGATDEHHVALLGQEPATREITDQSLVNRGTVEPELVHVLGQRQLGGGDLILDRARLLLGDLGRDKVADNLLWLMLAFDGGRDDGVKRRAHAVELQLAHGGEDSGAFHQGPLLRLS
ncbi:hypothetical protein ROTAS13_04713 [Roseomonas sp. TAS13]|nr:hypothetical protein ROTAS13_04713 [Roseomonas sp. TAS13]